MPPKVYIKYKGCYWELSAQQLIQLIKDFEDTQELNDIADNYGAVLLDEKPKNRPVHELSVRLDVTVV